jgi:hypothetical protein
MAGLGLKSCVASFLFYLQPPNCTAIRLCALLFPILVHHQSTFASSFAASHLFLDFPQLLFVLKYKSMAPIMAEKFMTGALYEACYVV